MAKKPATEKLLEKILKDLDTIIAEQTKNKGGSGGSSSGSKKGGGVTNVTINAKGAEDTVAALAGLGLLGGNGNKKDIVEMVNSLDKIINADPKKIKAVADAIKDLVVSVNSIKISQGSADGIKGLSLFVESVGKLNIKSMFNFVILSMIMSKKRADRIAKFI